MRSVEIKTLLQLSLSLSLLYIGAYTTTIVLFIAYIFSFIKIRYIDYMLYLAIVSLVLVEIFASSFYILYFINLFLVLYYLYKSQNIMTPFELSIFIVYMLFLRYLYNYFEEFRYELYLDLNIVDRLYGIDAASIYLLSSLHILVLFFMGYNREKLFRI